MNELKKQEVTVLINRKTVRRALKGIKYRDLLVDQELTGLAIVEDFRLGKGYGDNAGGRGLALRELLIETIEELNTASYKGKNGKKGYYALIRHEFFDDPLPENFGPYAKSHHDRLVGQALDAIVGILIERENALQQVQPVEINEAQKCLPALQRGPGIFVGRENLKQQIHADLNAGRNVALHGLPGAGKSALAAIVALERQQRGERVLWLDVQQREWEQAVYRNIGHIFDDQDIVNIVVEELPVYTRSLLEQQSLHLIVLDDVWDGYAARQFEREALPIGCCLLVTGRERVGVGRVYDVPCLDASDSAQLFRYYANLSEQENVDPVCALLGGLPQALEIAGRKLSIDGDTVSGLYNHLRQARSASALVRSLALSDAERENIWMALGTSYLALSNSQDEQALLLAFGALWSRTATPELLGLYTGLTAMDVDTALTRLVRRSMIQPEVTVDGVKRYRLHDLVYDFAHAAQSEAHELSNAQTQMALACASYVSVYAQQDRSAHDRLDAERNNLFNAIEWAAMNRHPKVVNQMMTGLWAASQFLPQRGYAHDSIKLLTMAIEAAQALDDVVAEWQHRDGLGTAYSLLGLPETAREHHQEALKLAHDFVDDPATELQTLSSLASDYVSVGQFGKAQHYCQQALDIARQIQDRQREGRILNELGYVLRRIGKPDEAYAVCEQALGIAREIGDRSAEAATLDILGLFTRGKNSTQAILFHQQAVDIYNELGDLVAKGSALGNLGLAYDHAGQFEQALNVIEESVAIARKTFHRRFEGLRLGLLAYIYNKMRQPEKAVRFYEQALHIARSVSDEHGTGIQLNGLGAAYIDAGQLSQSLKPLEESWQILHRLGDMGNEGFALGYLGKAHRLLHDFDIAEKYLNQALMLHRKCEHQLGEGMWLHELGALCVDKAAAADGGKQIEHYQRARIYLQDALTIFESIEYPFTAETVKLMDSL